jgi:hypothetical protein
LEEQFALLDSHNVKVRVGSAQGAGRFFDQITFQRVRAAAGKDAGGLFGQVFGGERHFVLDGNVRSRMFAEFDFLDLPNRFCHTCLLNSDVPSLKEKRLPCQ